MSNDTSAGRNFDMPSKEIALQQIFVATGYSVPPSKIKFGPASMLDVLPENFTDENSFAPAVIDPTEDARFNGDNGFIYRRLDLTEDLPINEDIASVPISYPFKVHEALPLINSFLGTQLSVDDLENDTFTQAPVTLRAKASSLAWIGKRVITPTGSSQYLIPDPLFNSFVAWSVGEDAETYYDGTSKNRLTALINEQAGTSLVEGVNFNYGTISSLASGPYNTRVRINPIGGAFVAQDVYFNRLSLAVLNDLPQGTLHQVAITQLPFTIHGALAQINAALGLQLTANEVFNTTYTEASAKYLLQIRSGSLAWVPSFYEFTANLDAAQNIRLLEDGTPRLMEDGSMRLLETPPV